MENRWLILVANLSIWMTFSLPAACAREWRLSLISAHWRDAFDSAKNRKGLVITAKREKSQTPKFVTAKW